MVVTHESHRPLQRMQLPRSLRRANRRGLATPGTRLGVGRFVVRQLPEPRLKSVALHELPRDLEPVFHVGQGLPLCQIRTRGSVCWGRLSPGKFFQEFMGTDVGNRCLRHFSFRSQHLQNLKLSPHPERICYHPHGTFFASR